ncbi:hypothetical protein FH972_012819 [Carpinus fangiana]|uniref:Uncharacterized protein n=1 Tax=Carpinus fangiana TaxID=176857 RepID=A0A5N6R555_9ROSI|nr:hypothetical protein FH972_012819 [Carpinus fangiana]
MGLFFQVLFFYSSTLPDCCCPRWLLKQEVPKIVKSINRQLREKSIKTKVGAFSVLKELVVDLPDCLADHIGSPIPGIGKALSVSKLSAAESQAAPFLAMPW